MTYVGKSVNCEYTYLDKAFWQIQKNAGCPQEVSAFAGNGEPLTELSSVSSVN